MQLADDDIFLTCLVLQGDDGCSCIPMMVIGGLHSGAYAQMLELLLRALVVEATDDVGVGGSWCRHRPRASASRVLVGAMADAV